MTEKKNFTQENKKLSKGVLKIHLLQSYFWVLYTKIK